MRDYYSGQTDTVQNGQNHAATCRLASIAGTRGNRPYQRLLTGATPPFILCTDKNAMACNRQAQTMSRHKDGMQRDCSTFTAICGESTGLSHSNWGRDALWINSPFEQIHGWVGGRSKRRFSHYALSAVHSAGLRTTLDANIWAAADLRARWSTARTSANPYFI